MSRDVVYDLAVIHDLTPVIADVREILRPGSQTIIAIVDRQRV